VRIGAVAAIGGRAGKIGFGILALIGAAIYSGSMPAASLASSPPTIESESVSHVTEHGATLEAQIKPDGLETIYAFWTEHEVCPRTLPVNEQECYVVLLGPLEEGRLLASDQGQTVSASLTGLEADNTYAYLVLATNSAGPATGMVKSFRTAQTGGGLETEGKTIPIPENTPTPFERKIEPWAAESLAAGAARAAALAEEKAKELAERQRLESPQYKEEQERKEVEAREAEERAEEAAWSSTKRSSATMCCVPSLRGDSLAAARSALRSAHCKLGMVTKPRRHNGALIVVRQSRPHGTKLRHGTAIAVDLGTRRAS
jgi:hypothetical protein